MKITYHVRQRRDASYDIIRREIANGIDVEEEFARTLLDRADNRRFRKGNDKFIIRRDLLGMYILTEKSKDKFVVVTHIDLNDALRQGILKKIFITDIPNGTKEENSYELSLSKAIISKYSIDTINRIKERALDESERFKLTEEYPCHFFFDVQIDLEAHTFRVSKKKDNSKCIRVSMLG